MYKIIYNCTLLPNYLNKKVVYNYISLIVQCTIKDVSYVRRKNKISVMYFDVPYDYCIPNNVGASTHPCLISLLISNGF